MRLTAVRHELVVGWFLAATLVLAAAALAFTARTNPLVGGLRVWVVVPHAEGLEPGSPVLVRGIRVGETGSIGFTKEGRVRFACYIAAEHTEVIRKDAVATVTPAPVLGTTKVELEPGASAEPAAHDQELAARQDQSLLERVAQLEERLTTFLDRLDGLAAVTSAGVDEVRGLVARVERGDGLAARVIGDPAFAADVTGAAASARRVADRVDQELLDRAARTLDQADAGLAEGRALAAKLGDDEGRLMTLLADADLALVDARRALAEARVGETVAAVRSTVESVGASAAGVADSARRAAPTADDARAAFEALRRASEALAQVAGELSRQPNSVIFGREPGMRR